MNMLKTKFIAALLSCSLGGAIAIGEGKYVVEQKDKQFVYKGARVATLKINVGDVVEFKNIDPYFHNVFSLSDITMFDLGSYAQGKSKSVKFDKRGKIEIECAIHPQMHTTVEVK